MKDIKEFLISGIEEENFIVNRRKGTIDFSRIKPMPDNPEEKKPEYRYYISWDDKLRLLGIIPLSIQRIKEGKKCCIDQHNFPDCPESLASINKEDIDRCMRCPYGGVESEVWKLYALLVDKDGKPAPVKYDSNWTTGETNE